MSVMPAFLIALMIFQGMIFKREKVENGFRTKYGGDLTADEENSMFSVGSRFIFATIPWMIPFVIFFSSFIKALSIIVYFVGLCGGLFIYRIKNKSKIKSRMNKESAEKQNQEKKEELGEWK
jgi:predicted membrane protein